MKSINIINKLNESNDRLSIDKMLEELYIDYKINDKEEDFWIDLGRFIDDYDRVLEWYNAWEND